METVNEFVGKASQWRSQTHVPQAPLLTFGSRTAPCSFLSRVIPKLLRKCPSFIHGPTLINCSPNCSQYTIFTLTTRLIARHSRTTLLGTLTMHYGGQRASKHGCESRVGNASSVVMGIRVCATIRPPSRSNTRCR